MKHAVLHQMNKGDYYGMLDSISDTTLSVYAPTLESIHAAMEANRITTLWVMPGCMFSQQIRKEHFDAMDKQVYDTFVPEQGIRQGRPYGASISFNRQNALKRYLMFPEHREWKGASKKDKGVWHAPEPQDLLRTINYLQEEYKTDIIWSPSHVALDRLREIHRIQERVIQPLPQEQKEQFTEIARQCCNWIAWTSRQPITRKYIVGYDKNAQFLGAAQSVRLGNGGFIETRVLNGIYSPDWEYYPDGDVWPDKFLSPGFHEYELLDMSESIFNSSGLPCPLDRVKGWASTDLIRCCLKIGLKIQVTQSIVWPFNLDKPYQHQYLGTWAKDMWQHRSNLKTLPQYNNEIARNNALSTAKLIPNSMIGRFATDAGEEYEHPDWNRAIVNRATANQVYSLNKMVRDFGIELVLVSKDAFYIQTDEPHPAYAIPGILDHMDEQRGYKFIGMTEMNESIAAAFQRVDDKRFGVAGVEQEIKRNNNA